MHNYNNVTITSGKEKLTEKFVSEFLSLITTIPPLQKLFSEASRGGQLQIKLQAAQANQAKASFSQSGTPGQVARVISIEDAASAAQFITFLVFELCNANNPYFALHHPSRIKPEHFKDRDGYAYAIEKAEYTHTHLPSRRILNEVFTNRDYIAQLERLGCRFSNQDILNLTRDGFRSFDHWWQHVNEYQHGKTFRHADCYREYYDTAMAQKAPVAAPAVGQPEAKPGFKHVQTIRPFDTKRVYEVRQGNMSMKVTVQGDISDKALHQLLTSRWNMQLERRRQKQQQMTHVQFCPQRQVYQAVRCH